VRRRCLALNALLSHRANVCEALRVPIDMFAGIASELAYRQRLIRGSLACRFLSGIHGPASIAVRRRSGTFFGVQGIGAKRPLWIGRLCVLAFVTGTVDQELLARNDIWRPKTASERR
jgi:hypothetical protein